MWGLCYFDLWGRIQPFFSKRLLYATGVFVFILACVGTLLWLAERKDNEQFPTSPARGIGNGMWCAISTMTTTGYGDIAPVTLAGRIIACGWREPESGRGNFPSHLLVSDDNQGCGRFSCRARHRAPPGLSETATRSKI